MRIIYSKENKLVIDVISDDNSIVHTSEDIIEFNTLSEAVYFFAKKKYDINRLLSEQNIEYGNYVEGLYEEYIYNDIINLICSEWNSIKLYTIEETTNYSLSIFFKLEKKYNDVIQMGIKINSEFTDINYVINDNNIFTYKVELQNLDTISVNIRNLTSSKSIKIYTKIILKKYLC